MIDNISRDLCCGCAACYDSCAIGAIVFNEEDCGFLYPAVNKELCISCGKCLSACGAYFDGVSKDKSILKVYAAQNTENTTLKNSSSGGVFSAAANYILDAKGVVCGAGFDDDLTLKHIVIDDRSALPKLMGSKYIQSNTRGIYKTVKKHLNNGVLTMFVGTPCQVRALKMFLKKDYDNLIAVDIICHGVPSQGFFDKYKQYLSKKHRRNVREVYFRDKIRGWKGFCVKIVFDDGNEIYENMDDNLYMRLFLNNFSIRNSCYNCRANNYRSESDITLGDFWNIERRNEEFADNRGTSAVIVNSLKGAEFFENIKKRLRYCEDSLDYLVKNNHVLECSVSVPTKKESFIRNYMNENIDKLDDFCLCESYLDRIKKRVKRVIRRIR